MSFVTAERPAASVQELPKGVSQSILPRPQEGAKEVAQTTTERSRQRAFSSRSYGRPGCSRFRDLRRTIRRRRAYRQWRSRPVWQDGTYHTLRWLEGSSYVLFLLCA